MRVRLDSKYMFCQVELVSYLVFVSIIYKQLCPSKREAAGSAIGRAGIYVVEWSLS